MESVDTDDDGMQQRSADVPCHVFPELITEQSELGEEQIYGAAAEDAIEWREAWAECRSARYALDWVRAERKRLDLEIRLIGEFGLTPPPADVP
ncbi:MAG: hypothetical protein F4209_08340 [Chloroflexi bacterium]|nr:hypothetical protein [Chloroflexota bacterium]MYF22745.1 hypothetical protein [Chloroflexota bacterium]